MSGAPDHAPLAGVETGVAAERREVVLIHGLWFSRWTLAPLGTRLARHGFRPIRYAWDTTGRDFAASAQELAGFLTGLGAPRLDLVGHSLGGLLIRALLHAHPGLPPGRVVTLGTPHLGSRSGRVAAQLPLGPRILGRAVAQLVAEEPARWNPPGRELGALAGTRSLGLGRLLPGLERPNDGVVSLREARYSEASDFRALPVTHTGMLFSRAVADHVARFLLHGRF